MRWEWYLMTYAWMDSVTLPIWLTFSNRQLQAFTSIPFWTLFGFVTSKSSLKKKPEVINSRCKNNINMWFNYNHPPYSIIDVKLSLLQQTACFDLSKLLTLKYMYRFPLNIVRAFLSITSWWCRNHWFPHAMSLNSKI